MGGYSIRRQPIGASIRNRGKREDNYRHETSSFSSTVGIINRDTNADQHTREVGLGENERHLGIEGEWKERCGSRVEECIESAAST